MSKYYAVRRGKKTGIFKTWNECEAQIKGFSGAEYKSFLDLESAKKFLNEGSSRASNLQEDVLTNDSSALQVYIDGSYSRTQKKASYGCVFLNKGIIVGELSEVVTNGTEDLWNVTGEMNGAIAATEWAISQGYSSVVIYYDYEGIEKWYKGIWKTNKNATQFYKEKMLDYSNEINITFVKVKAHSGDYYNELADRLAKEAINKERNNDRHIVNTKLADSNLFFKELYKENIDEKDYGQVQFEIKEYILNDKIIGKIVKKVWKSEGYLMKELKGYNAAFNILENKIEIIFIKNNMEKIKKIIDI